MARPRSRGADRVRSGPSRRSPGASSRSGRRHALHLVRPTAWLAPEERRELAGLALVGSGLVLAAALAFPGQGTIAAFLDRSLGRALGVGGWLLAAGIVLAGVRVLVEERWRGGAVGVAGCALASSAVLGLLGVTSPEQAGWWGRHLASGLASRLGTAATATALIAVACLGLVLGLDVRVRPLLAAAGRRLRDLRSARRASRSPVVREVTGRADAGPPRLADGPPGRLPPGDAPSPPPAFGGLDIGLEPLPIDLVTPSEPLPIRGVAVADPAASEVPAPARGATTVGAAAAAASPTSVTSADIAEPAGPSSAVAAEASPPPATSADPELPSEEPEKVWVLPGPDLLDTVQARRERLEQEVRSTAATIESTLRSFGVEARVCGANTGPTVTQYELQPAKGVPVRRIIAHQTDLSLALAAPIRIQAPIPGKSAIGIEVPNHAAQLVTIREIVTSRAFSEVRSRLGVALGADVSGQPVVGDLTRMPHLLIAGATGSGKSVCINAVLAGFLLQATPAQLKLILIDPKRVELSNFADLPHLLVPVVVEPEAAVASLRWAVREMEERYKLFAAHGARNILAFNERAPEVGLRPLPYIVVVIDELADLMMVAAGEIEDLICRIAQLARAVGIHLIVATQRPSADIITGLIKANIPSRIAFAVSSGVDSRVILDEMGAEKLLGRGDMLYLPIDEGKPRRLQGAFVSDRELDRLIDFWRRQGKPEYQEEIFQVEATVSWARDAGKRDPLFAKAAHVVAAEGRAAASLLQRKLNIGYTRAARLIDQLAEHRIVGPYEGSKSREVLMDVMQVDELLAELGEE